MKYQIQVRVESMEKMWEILECVANKFFVLEVGIRKSNNDLHRCVV